MEAWYEGLVDLRLLHLAGRMARTEGEKAKIRETVLLGAQRKMDFRTLRRGLMRLCETLQARRASEAAK